MSPDIVFAVWLLFADKPAEIVLTPKGQLSSQRLVYTDPAECLREVARRNHDNARYKQFVTEKLVCIAEYPEQ